MKRTPKILLGILIGGMTGLIVWYWQKSTSAEEGALDLLDRMAAIEKRLRELQGKLPQRQHAGLDITDLPSRPAGPAVAPDDLLAINGIGPTYARRLQAAGIVTFADLAGHSADRLREIAQIKPWHVHNPAEWIEEARLRRDAA